MDMAHICLVVLPDTLGSGVKEVWNYSHSIVDGGFEEMS